MRRDLGLELEWVYFPLHPETPGEGRTLESLFAGRGYDLDVMHQRMAALMAEEGLPYGRRTHTYNSRLAQELAAWGDGQPGGEALHGELYRAYFVDGRNIGDVGVLVSLAEAAGLDVEEARQVIEGRTMRALVDEHWSTSTRAGITGVPTFEAGGYRAVGAQPEAVLRQLVTAASGPRAPEA